MSFVSTRNVWSHFTLNIPHVPKIDPDIETRYFRPQIALAGHPEKPLPATGCGWYTALIYYFIPTQKAYLDRHDCGGAVCRSGRSSKIPSCAGIMPTVVLEVQWDRPFPAQNPGRWLSTRAQSFGNKAAASCWRSKWFLLHSVFCFMNNFDGGSRRTTGRAICYRINPCDYTKYLGFRARVVGATASSEPPWIHISQDHEKIYY